VTQTQSLILIDEDSRRRAGISHMLAGSGMHVEPFETVEEVGARWTRAGIVLAHDGDHTIVRTVAGLAQAGTWLPVIAYAAEPAPQRIVETILAGAIGYAAWPFDVQAFAAERDRARERAARIASARTREALARRQIERLTRREREVLTGVASGLSNRLIAEQLSISPRTVEIHRANMLNKMDLGHTSEAIRIAIEAELVD